MTQDTTKTDLPPGEIKGSGIPGLDSLLGGGFSQGRVVLVLREPGTGKTILVSQFLHAGASSGNQNAMMIGMNEQGNRFMSEMAGVGLDFSSLEKSGKFAYLDATELSVSWNTQEWEEYRLGEGS